MSRVILSIAVLFFGLAVSPPTSAVMRSTFQIQTGASMCTPSTVSVDTAVRPRATGFGNEGDASVFVICTFGAPDGSTGMGTYQSGGVDWVYFTLKSLDGGEHTVTCTGVNSLEDGIVLGISPPVYVTKNIIVNDTGRYGAFGTTIAWMPVDFTGDASDTVIPDASGAFSITCLLPPNVSIKYGAIPSQQTLGP